MSSEMAVYRTANGYVYVQAPDGKFHVVRPDGGSETRNYLPPSAVELAPRGARLTVELVDADLGIA